MGQCMEMFEKIFPKDWREEIKALDYEKLQEIRIRVGQPVYVSFGKNEDRLMCEEQEVIATTGHIRQMMSFISQYSLYAYEEEMKQGYITIQGGHRIGISGQALMEQGRVKNIAAITFLNIRVAHQIIGVADEVMGCIMGDDGKLSNVLIVSPPKRGKTTLLRDMVRQISNAGKNVSVIDERSEIAACYRGIPQNDVGSHTDVLDGATKPEGIRMMLRAFAPEVIAVDEIGTSEDVDAIHKALYSGCAIIATIHGDGMEEVCCNPNIRKIVEEKVFDYYIFLKQDGSREIRKERRTC